MPRVHRTGNLAEFEKDKPTYIAIDTETTGVGYWDRAFCVTIAWTAETVVKSLYLELPRHAALAQKLLMSSRTWVFHNAKFDLQKLEAAGVIGYSDIMLHNVMDTECLAWLYDETKKKNLKYLAKEYLGEDTNEEAEMRRIRRVLKLKKDDGYDKLPSLTVVPYALKDAEYTIRLCFYFYKRLPARMIDIIARKEMELMRVLFDMERHGIGVDRQYLKSQITNHNDAIMEIDEELESLLDMEVKTGPRKKSDPPSFNPNSHVQIIETFSSLGFTISGTDKETLENLNFIKGGIRGSKAEKFRDLLLDRRHASKILHTYLENIEESLRVVGIYHGNYRQWGTKTGRLSSGGSEG